MDKYVEVLVSERCVVEELDGADCALGIVEVRKAKCLHLTCRLHARPVLQQAAHLRNNVKKRDGRIGGRLKNVEREKRKRKAETKKSAYLSIDIEYESTQRQNIIKEGEGRRRTKGKRKARGDTEGPESQQLRRM